MLISFAGLWNYTGAPKIHIPEPPYVIIIMVAAAQ